MTNERNCFRIVLEIESGKLGYLMDRLRRTSFALFCIAIVLVCGIVDFAASFTAGKGKG
jgi:hypothetical protein